VKTTVTLLYMAVMSYIMMLTRESSCL